MAVRDRNNLLLDGFLSGYTFYLILSCLLFILRSIAPLSLVVSPLIQQADPSQFPGLPCPYQSLLVCTLLCPDAGRWLETTDLG